MKEWLARFKEKPWIAHLFRAITRFISRLGSQFGAAITYFSVLALVPLLMLAFLDHSASCCTVRPPGLMDDVGQCSWRTASGRRPRATRAKDRRIWSTTH